MGAPGFVGASSTVSGATFMILSKVAPLWVALTLVSMSPALAVDTAPAATPPKSSRETILFVRHGEKQAEGRGQLNCKGLNRSLALAGLIAKRYGHIDAVFAPNPSKQKPDGDGSYDYVRPLATIEPTAIRFGLPVQSELGYDEIGKLRELLLAPAYRDATILVGWEHHKLNEMVPAMITALGGDAKPVEWAKTDFDTIWRVVLEWGDGKVAATFFAEKQGLDGLPEACPD